MTQLIIDNATSISLNRDVTVASTVSQSRNLTYFRSGPIQTVVIAQISAVHGDTWRAIQAATSGSLVGPYSLTFPDDVLPDAITGTPLVQGASQTDNTIVTDGWNGSATIPAGTLVKFAGVNGSYLTTVAVTASAAGVATLTLDQPVVSAPADNAAITTNRGITFSMHLTDTPRATYIQGVGHVRTRGQFVFSEVI